MECKAHWKDAYKNWRYTRMIVFKAHTMPLRVINEVNQTDRSENIYVYIDCNLNWQVTNESCS